MSRKNPERHGMSGTPEYRAWRDMITRCTKPNYYEAEYYIGRGIKVHDGWRKSFLTFYEHIGKRPSKVHSLDRIDNNGNYEPGNVRWATKQEQVLNRRVQKNNTSGFVGVYWDKLHNFWVADIKRNGKSKRLGYFNTKIGAKLARDKALTGEVK